MIKLNLTPEQVTKLQEHSIHNPCPRGRKKCLIVLLRGRGLSNKEIFRIVQVNADSIATYVKKYREGGLPLLLEENYYKPPGRLDGYESELKELFESNPPHTVNQAIEMIEEKTGIRISPTSCRDLLRKLGMRCRRCGVIPGKVLNDEKHLQNQQEFHDEKLGPVLKEAESGNRVVLFVDAAHFVMGAFLGMLWCFQRLFLPSSSGRKRYNVLGAYDPIRREVLTITNDSVVNQETFCQLLKHVAESYAPTKLPITLVLDNARYQKTKVVFEKAKELGITLLYLPPYSPNLNLIERLWRLIKKKVLYSKYYDNFAKFKESIDTCLADLNTRYSDAIKSLMTLKFQLFNKSEKITV